jgi:hypothetical protein
VRLFPDHRYHCQPDTMDRSDCIIRHNHTAPGLSFVKMRFEQELQHRVTFEYL